MACSKITLLSSSAGEAQDSAWTQTPLFSLVHRNGANDDEQPRSVPLVPSSLDGVDIQMLRHALLLAQVRQ